MKKKIFWGVAGVFILVFTILWLNRLAGVMRGGGGSESAVVEPYPEKKSRESDLKVDSRKNFQCSNEGKPLTSTRRDFTKIKVFDEWQSVDEIPQQEENGSPVRWVTKGGRPVGFVKGRIVDEEGNGVEGVKVLFGYEMSPGRKVYTDKEGRFHSPAWIGGKKYFISYFPEDPFYLPSRFVEKMPEPEKIKDIPPPYGEILVEIPPEGGIVELPEIKLKKGGVIKGKVYAADGKTVLREIESVCVTGYEVINEGAEKLKCTRGQVKAILEEDGSYMIEQVPPAESVTVAVQPFGYMRQVVEGVKVEPGKITYVDFVIPTDDPTGIKGVVTDAETGEPIEGAGVHLTNSEIDKLGNDVGVAITDEEGRFSIKGLVQGIYDVQVLTGGKYLSVIKKDKKVTEGEEIFLEFKLKKAEGGFQTIIEDPVPQNVNCDETLFKNSIKPAFDSAQSKIQSSTGSCGLPTVWSKLSGIQKVNIYCKPKSPYKLHRCAEVPKLGSVNIILYIKDDGSPLCPDQLESTMYHELIHVGGFGEEDAYTCSYRCYGLAGGCITCEKPTIPECQGLYIEQDFCSELPNPSLPLSEINPCMYCDKFERKVIDPCAEPCKRCNPETRQCEPKCKDPCSTCNPQTGVCEPKCDPCSTCNPQTGACEPKCKDLCSNRNLNIKEYLHSREVLVV